MESTTTYHEAAKEIDKKIEKLRHEHFKHYTDSNTNFCFLIEKQNEYSFIEYCNKKTSVKTFVEMIRNRLDLKPHEKLSLWLDYNKDDAILIDDILHKQMSVLVKTFKPFVVYDYPFPIMHRLIIE